LATANISLLEMALPLGYPNPKETPKAPSLIDCFTKINNSFNSKSVKFLKLSPIKPQRIVFQPIKLPTLTPNFFEFKKFKKVLKLLQLVLKSSILVQVSKLDN
jgi:hypothetical protein